MVVSSKLKIDFWNSAAQKLFGFNSAPAAEMRLEQLPVPPALRSRLVRRHRATLSRNTRAVLRNEVLDGPKSRANLNVHFTPLAHNGAPESALIMFEVMGRSTESAGTNEKPAARQAARSGSNPSARGKAKAGRRK
jgi:nitrogen-specific signal transduction histidine kinase